jgi:hypothetical protein
MKPFLLIAVLLLTVPVSAQRPTLNTLLRKADTGNGFDDLRQALERYTGAPPDTVEARSPEAKRVLLFRRAGVGISNAPFGCRECIGTFVAYPALLREPLPFLGVKPRATVADVLATMKAKNPLEEPSEILYHSERKTLYVYLLNFSFFVENVALPSLQGLERAEMRIPGSFFKINVPGVRKYVPNFTTLKVTAVQSNFPPPAEVLREG